MKSLAREQDPIQLVKLIGDIATGQVEICWVDNGKNAAASPFEQIKAALSTVVSVPKSSLSKTTKKSKKK